MTRINDGVSKFRGELKIVGLALGFFGVLLVSGGIALRWRLHIPDEADPVSPEMYFSMIDVVKTITAIVLPVCGATFLLVAYFVVKGAKMLDREL